MCIHSHIFPTLDIFLSIASEEANTRISRLQSCDLAALEGTGKQRLKRRKIILPCILGGLGRKSGTGGMWTNTGRKASALIRSPSTCLGHSRMELTTRPSVTQLLEHCLNPSLCFFHKSKLYTEQIKRHLEALCFFFNYYYYFNCRTWLKLARYAAGSTDLC